MGLRHEVSQLDSIRLYYEGVRASAVLRIVYKLAITAIMLCNNHPQTHGLESSALFLVTSLQCN